MIKGIIFNIGRYAVHDGPGIRTTIFLKGCPAKCLWCCSPQSQSFDIERSQVQDKIFGREITVAELFREVRRDAPFWRRSGGGVTLSGGEVMAQPDFAVAFLNICREHGIHTAIETCLFASHDVAEKVADAADFIQFDIKTMDPELHKRLTSIDNSYILDNASMILKSSKPALVRFPLVPGVNDSLDGAEKLGAFLETQRAGVTLEVLKYHRMGVGLYEELGRKYELPYVQPPTTEEFEKFCSVLSKYDIRVI